jgi:hypothetical protein
MPTALDPAAPPAPALTRTPPPAGSLRPAVGYFQRRWPAALILAALPAVGLPAAAAVLRSANEWVLWGYVWLFGMTHFVITLAVYLRAENLRHFAGSWRTAAVFLVVPALLFVSFDVYHALRVGAVFPAVGLAVLCAVRIADFHHFNRQSFGVLQLFKARTGAKPPAELKRTENLYFATLTALIFVTFLAGGVCPLALPGGPLSRLPAMGGVFEPLVPLAAAQVAWAGLLAVALGLFGLVAARLWRATGSPAAAGYLGVQTVAALTAAAYLPLYIAALAVHYVEYHVLMAPRCFRTPLDPRSRLDRAYGAVRARPAVFYGLVLATAAVVTLCTRAGMGMMGRDPAAAGRPVGYLALIAVFDGLFVFHYFVEMFIWRFGDPHFRRELGGLYFAK